LCEVRGEKDEDYLEETERGVKEGGYVFVVVEAGEDQRAKRILIM
jgi:hypothetical protein